jgi:hypothetical protein
LLSKRSDLILKILGVLSANRKLSRNGLLGQQEDLGAQRPQAVLTHDFGVPVTRK